MSKDFVLQLRYLGVLPQTGYLEYGFRIENKDKSVRQVILTIEDSLFRKDGLMFQEAPDLCYQKVLMDLENENEETRLPAHVPITALDIAHYRGLHPNVKLRKSFHREAK
jgi:hypothetical protein